VPLQFAFGNSNQLSKKERTNSEAQVDRFMLKTVIDYPKMDEDVWLFVKT
jgi:MoxR-like ATPase